MIYDKAVEKTKLILILLVSFMSLFFLSFILNILLGVCLYFNKNNFNTIVSPLMNVNNSIYKISSRGINANYIRDMSLSFISLRYNFTPETVYSQYELLLSYIDEENRPIVADSLNKEIVIIKRNDITSFFNVTDYKIIGNNIFEVKGVIKNYTGKNEIVNKKSTFRVYFEYINGLFKVQKIIEVLNEKNN